MKTESSYTRIKRFMLEKKQATNAEIAEYMRGTKGQLSWGQRLRDLRQELIKEGGNLECEEIRPGIYLYKVIPPATKVEPNGQLCLI